MPEIYCTSQLDQVSLWARNVNTFSIAVKIHLEHYPISETSQYRSLNKSRYVDVYFLVIHQLFPEISDLDFLVKKQYLTTAHIA